MMSLAEFFASATGKLQALYPLQEARNMASLLLCERLGLQSWVLHTEGERPIPPDCLGLLESDLDRLLHSEPLQYVLGKAPFYGRDFRVSPAVLIPRPETEELVQHALDFLSSCNGKDLRALDLCTGSGCIAWTLALECPGLQVRAVDISEKALELARCQFPQSAPSVDFVQGDVLDPGFLRSLGTYELLVSNPPYIMEKEKEQMLPNVLDFEPSLALFVSDSDPLLFYRAIADASVQLLNPGACCLVECNALFCNEVAALFQAKSAFSEVSVLKDISSRPRFVLARTRADGSVL